MWVCNSQEPSVTWHQQIQLPEVIGSHHPWGHCWFNPQLCQLSSILQKRFGNKLSPAMWTSCSMQALSPRRTTLKKGLCHLYNQIESYVQGLKSLGIALKSYQSLLSSVLLNKLFQEVRLSAGKPQMTVGVWITAGRSWSRNYKQLAPLVPISQGSKFEISTHKLPCYPELPNFVVVIASKLTPLARVLSWLKLTLGSKF